MTIFKFCSLSFRFVKVSRSRENRWPSICPDHKGWVLFHKVSKSGTKKLRGAGEKTSCWIGFGNLVGISSNMKVGWKTASNQKRLEKGRDWVRGNRAALQQLCVSCYQQTSSCRALSSFFLPPIAPTEPSKANVLAYSASFPPFLMMFCRSYLSYTVVSQICVALWPNWYKASHS